MLDAQNCVDTVDVQQQGIRRRLWPQRYSYVIVPRSNLSCNGRITGYMASLYRYDDDDECYLPSILIWHPLNTKQMMYGITHNYTLNTSDVNQMQDYYFANISFVGDDRVEIHPGDVIGYQQKTRPCYRVSNIRREGYTSYSYDHTTNGTINIDDDSSTYVRDNYQPLIQVVFGMTLTVALYVTVLTKTSIVCSSDYDHLMIYKIS